ncbi:replication initiation protein RepC, partial [Rhizobium ruizarguesonis]
NAATVIACILERGGPINSAGGYLRDLTRRADRGEFSLGPMLMALMRERKPSRRLIARPHMLLTVAASAKLFHSRSSGFPRRRTICP